MLVAFTTIELTPEWRDAYVESVREHAKVVNENDKGCIMYNVFQQVEDPTKVYVYAMWKDETAFEAHRSSAHNLAWREEIANFGDRTVRYYPCISVYPTDSE